MFKHQVRVKLNDHFGSQRAKELRVCGGCVQVKISTFDFTGDFANVIWMFLYTRACEVERWT